MSKLYTVIALMDGLPTTPHVTAPNPLEAVVESFHQKLGAGKAYGRDEVRRAVLAWWERGEFPHMIESADLYAVIPGHQYIELSSYGELQAVEVMEQTPQDSVRIGLLGRNFQPGHNGVATHYRRWLVDGEGKNVGQIVVEDRRDGSCNVGLYDEDGSNKRLPDDPDRSGAGGVPYADVLALVDKYIGVDPLILRVYPRMNDRVRVVAPDLTHSDMEEGVCIRPNDPQGDAQDWDYYARIRLDDGREIDVDVLQDIHLRLYRPGDAVEVQVEPDKWVPAVFVDNDDKNRPTCDAPGRRWEGCAPECVRHGKPELVVDGWSEANGAFMGDGESAPFVVFSVTKQQNIAGPFATRADAESHRQELLAGADPKLDGPAMKRELDRVEAD
jgi:hypothetical protein